MAAVRAHLTRRLGENVRWNAKRGLVVQDQTGTAMLFRFPAFELGEIRTLGLPVLVEEKLVGVIAVGRREARP